MRWTPTRLDFHRRVREGYQKLVKQDPGRWAVVDAHREWKMVQKELRQTIMRRIK